MNSANALLNGSTWTGRSLEQALKERPQLSLDFYSYGILLRKQNPNGSCLEYVVDAKEVAQVLAAKVEFTTGLIQDDLLLIQRSGSQELLISYRRGQKTGLWLEGSDAPLRLSLPPLLMLRVNKGQGQKHFVFAVKQRPKSFKIMLYHAPLPNIYHEGTVCWGSVRLQKSEANHLQADWAALLGTAFGNHSVGQKSQAKPNDIREQLLALAQEGGRSYPKNDLVSKRQTLAQVIIKEGFHVHET